MAAKILRNYDRNLTLIDKYMESMSHNHHIPFPEFQNKYFKERTKKKLMEMRKMVVVVMVPVFIQAKALQDRVASMQQRNTFQSS